jgi:hypothetical protein
MILGSEKLNRMIDEGLNLDYENDELDDIEPIVTEPQL